MTSFLTDEDTSSHDWASEAGADAKIVTSGDGGATWGNKLTFSQVQSFWPGLLDVDDTTFYGLADDGGSKAQLMTLG